MPAETLHHPLGEAPLIRGASTLTNHDEVYEMTRAHIRSGIPLGIMIDEDDMTLTPMGRSVRKGDQDLQWYALRNGSINPHIRLRFETPPPERPEKGTILLGIPETDSEIYSGFTVTETFSK